MGVELGQSRAPKGMRIYAVGDVHGCYDELCHILHLIGQDIIEKPVEDHRIVFVGDYTDRGPRSKDVIAHLMALRERDRRVICLRGNHDAMLLDFMHDPLNLKDPLKRGGIYFRNGIGTTLRAYGTRLCEDKLTDDVVQQMPIALGMLMSGFHQHFLKSLPCSVALGDYFFCHAGVRPDVALKDQDNYDLIWIRGDFLEYRKPFKKVIIHGHTPQTNVDVRNNRINVDTKCYASGVLTAVVLEGADYRFLQTG